MSSKEDSLQSRKILYLLRSQNYTLESLQAVLYASRKSVMERHGCLTMSPFLSRQFLLLTKHEQSSAKLMKQCEIVSTSVSIVHGTTDFPSSETQKAFFAVCSNVLVRKSFLVKWLRISRVECSILYNTAHIYSAEACSCLA